MDGYDDLEIKVIHVNNINVNIYYILNIFSTF